MDVEDEHLTFYLCLIRSQTRHDGSPQQMLP